jgi:hypothetical protein
MEARLHMVICVTALLTIAHHWLTTCSANGGKAAYGDMRQIVDKYRTAGFTCIPKGVLKDTIKTLESISTHNTTTGTSNTVSNLVVETESSGDECNKRGQAKGVKLNAKEELKKRLMSATTNATELFNIKISESNCGDGKMMQGGPKCTFSGKNVPCFVGTSPKASITSQLLADMLKHIDSYGLFERTMVDDRSFFLTNITAKWSYPFWAISTNKSTRGLFVLVCLMAPISGKLTILWS